MAGQITFESDEAVLVRPDGHVAWRPGSVENGRKAVALRSALASILRPDVQRPVAVAAQQTGEQPSGERNEQEERGKDEKRTCGA
jgi:hypothetical protein